MTSSGDGAPSSTDGGARQTLAGGLLALPADERDACNMGCMDGVGNGGISDACGG
jgi:hypothetical protein